MKKPLQCDVASRLVEVTSREFLEGELFRWATEQKAHLDELFYFIVKQTDSPSVFNKSGILNKNGCLLKKKNPPWTPLLKLEFLPASTLLV